MEFHDFSKFFQSNVDRMLKDKAHLFLVEVDKDEFWNLYLDSFPSGTNEIYRKRREYDCSCCRNFIKNFGNVVTIENNKIQTIWDLEISDFTFQTVANTLSEYIKSKAVSDVFVTKLETYGTGKTLENLGDRIKTWNHFFYKLPKALLYKGSDTIDTVKSNYRTTKEVFQRSLNEISLEAVDTVLDLIAENQLYRGEEWKEVLNKFKSLQLAYSKAENKNNFCWEHSVKNSGSVTRIKNHSIGTLLNDLSEGIDLDIALRKYDSVVAPTNYKRPKAVYTAKMVEDAKQNLEKLGLLNSLERRFASISDITVNNVLWVNREAQKKMKDSIFESMKKEATQSKVNTENLTSIGVEKFIADILPTVTSLEAYVENIHEGNFVSLIAPKEDCKSLFKWNNNFSWAYNGNIADSMKQRVKEAGGKVDGILRFSIQWIDNNDLDAHCIEPSKNEIFFGKKVSYNTKGNLDVDIIHPVHDKPSVENITWPNLNLMQEGEYTFFVNCYSNRGGNTGFTAEIEYEGNIYSYEYNKNLPQYSNVHVAKVTLKNGKFSIEHLLPSQASSKDIWNVKTNQFVPISTVMYSPNYWDEQTIGNKHYMFMLQNCKNPDQPNGFYNEFLNEDLMKQKKFFEALGSKMKAEKTDEQLSGLGFSSTIRNYLVVRIDNKKTVKIVF